jgi:broad specificity phosphatase PhoE
MGDAWNLVFLRHAQGRHNVDAVVRGGRAYYDPVNTDAELTEFGLADAMGAAVGTPADYDFILCSPLRRCHQTLLAAMPGAADATVLLDDRLMEPQGEAVCNRRMARGALDMAVPLAWCLGGVSMENPFDLVKEGHRGDERYDAFVARVRAFTEEVLEPMKEHHRRVLVVGHHDWIRVWAAEYLGRDVSLPNCGVFRCVWGEKSCAAGSG